MRHHILFVFITFVSRTSAAPCDVDIRLQLTQENEPLPVVVGLCEHKTTTSTTTASTTTATTTAATTTTTTRASICSVTLPNGDSVQALAGEESDQTDLWNFEAQKENTEGQQIFKRTADMYTLKNQKGWAPCSEGYSCNHTYESQDSQLIPTCLWTFPVYRDRFSTLLRSVLSRDEMVQASTNCTSLPSPDAILSFDSNTGRFAGEINKPPYTATNPPLVAMGQMSPHQNRHYNGFACYEDGKTLIDDNHHCKDWVSGTSGAAGGKGPAYHPLVSRTGNIGVEALTDSCVNTWMYNIMTPGDADPKHHNGHMRSWSTYNCEDNAKNSGFYGRCVPSAPQVARRSVEPDKRLCEHVRYFDRPVLAGQLALAQDDFKLLEEGRGLVDINSNIIQQRITAIQCDDACIFPRVVSVAENRFAGSVDIFVSPAETYATIPVGLMSVAPSCVQLKSDTPIFLKEFNLYKFDTSANTTHTISNPTVLRALPNTVSVIISSSESRNTSLRLIYTCP
jgi:hypothetical protein